MSQLFLGAFLADFWGNPPQRISLGILFEPAQAEGVGFEDDALARIVELSGCYAAFVQAYGKETWNMAPGSPIALADVQAAEPVVEAKLDEEFFHVRFEKATPAERRYMAAMADLGDGPYKTGDIAGRLGGRASSSSVHRDSLIKKGLIFSPDHGEVNFTVPHFSPFVRASSPEGQSARGSHSSASAATRTKPKSTSRRRSSTKRPSTA